MNEVQDIKKKRNRTNDYVKTFRCGAVAANIFRRQAPGGFEYLDFGLSRAWKSSNGKEGYSQNFFPGNCEPLHMVIDQACHYIGQQSGPADEIDETLLTQRDGGGNNGVGPVSSDTSE